MDKKFTFSCPHCGASFACPTCGKQCESTRAAHNALAGGTKFCTKCGKEIASALAEALAEANS